MSVGEWLNSVIEADDDDHGAPMRSAEYEDDEDDDLRDDVRRDYRRRPRSAYREPRRQRRDDTEAALARQEFGEVHARLDKLTNQLDRMARSTASRLTGAPAPQQRGRTPPPPSRPRPSNPIRHENGQSSVDDAVAEIAERQRTLYGETLPVAPPPLPEAPTAPPAHEPEPAEPPTDIVHLQDQLNYLTSRIEKLRPNGEIDKAINAVRSDLSDIREQLTEAQPRRAVQSLENEVKSLSDRLDHSRDHGADERMLAGLDDKLSEVRDALHGLTPAESLVGVDDTLQALSQKVDRIIAREDPAALQQLETAIGALRGIVSHVASNDTLNKVAEDVRELAVKVDALASTAASGEALAALENRFDTFSTALTASADAGHAVPRELEKLLTGLIEKLEWVQLTHTDHAALGQLEDRIAQFMKRLDASDAKLGNLEAVERGLADLLVYVDQARGANGAAAAPAMRNAGAVDTIERDVAEIKRSERRTQDSLEAVHGAVEQVVDRLAMIESGLHDDAVGPATIEPAPVATVAPAQGTAQATVMMPSLVMESPPTGAAPSPPVTEPSPALPAEPSAHRPTGAARSPIDPNLPPDHPLEPRSASPRPMPSAADRIAASEAAVGFAKPPVISEPGEKTDFIAAARRAAQAAAAAPAERPARAEAAAAIRATAPGKPSRLRKLLVAAAAVVIAVAGMHVALHMFQDRSASTNPATPPQQQEAPPPAVVPDTDSAKPRQSGPLILPVPGGSSESMPTTPPQSLVPEKSPNANTVVAPPANPARPAPPANPTRTAPPANPARQSSLSEANDITGSIARSAPPPVEPTPMPNVAAAQMPTAPATIVEKLPATIGGPALRAAAMAGDAAAEFEVATRFSEGHGIPPNNEAAARWLERAAKQGLPLAQFRLGGLYEKGIGVKKDLVMARDLYSAAAAKGNGKAMHNLAVLYAEGVNGPSDYHAAAHWFRKAADYGITDSQYNLAILYARGIGVEQNYTESYRWFALAAADGDSDAAKKRDEVATHLDQQSLAIAQAAVQKWTAEPQPEDATTVKAPPGGWDPPVHAAKPKPRQVGSKTAAPETKLN